MSQAFPERSAPVRFASQFVSDERLWGRHMELAAIGAIADNGVRRLTLTKEDGRARAKVIAWARELGMSCYTDCIGNLFLRYCPPSASTNAHPVATGSHLDSEPTGGRFDGTFGVLAGLEAVQALQEFGHVPRRAIEVVIWTNEEGCRFQPAYMGSLAFVSPKRIEALLAATDGCPSFAPEAFPESPQRRLVGGFWDGGIAQMPRSMPRARRTLLAVRLQTPPCLVQARS